MTARRALGLASLVALGLALAASPAPAQTNVVGQWGSLPTLPYFPVHAAVLPTGKVLIYPGDEGISGDQALILDPATGATTPATHVGYDIFCTGLSFLADGRLLVSGGHIQNGVGLAHASAYNPFTNAWTRLPEMNAGRWYPNNTTLPNGDMLVTSGDVDTTTGVNPLPQVYQAATGTWRNLTGAQLQLDLYPFMHVAPNGRVFNSGPSTTTRYLDTRGTGAWSTVATHLGAFRDYGSSVMYAPGKIVVMGGGDPPQRTAEIIDLNAGSPAWRSTGSMAFARRQMNATLLPDGTVLATGGTSGGGFNNPVGAVFAAELWNPSTGSWARMASAGVVRIYHSTALLLPDGRVLSMGGNEHPEVEVYSPPYLFKGARPRLTSAPGAVGYGQTFLVQTPDAASVTRVTWVRLPAVTHAFNQNQRINDLTFTAAAGGLNVTAPSNANLAPVGHYMLFLLNSQGVPSVASVVRLDAAAPTPATLTSLAPASATAGGAAFTLTVNGSNFVSGATVQWNGASRTTTFVGSGQLTAAITAADIAAAGSASVTVVNPGAAASNALGFTINPGGTTSCPNGQFFTQYFANQTLSGTPVFTGCETSINHNWGTTGPGVGGLGSTNFSVRWDGFFPFNAGTYTFTATTDDGMRVWVDGTLIINAWVLQAPKTYQATIGLTTGNHEVKVEYFQASGGAVAQVSWQAVAPPTPTLTSLSPSSATAGGAAFTLTVNGTSFINGATVQWNGSPRTTTFVSATQLTAAITAADIAAAGSASVTAANAGGTASNALAFTINPAAGPTPPSLTSLSPSSATAGGADFTLTANGAGFVSGATVQWNGAPRTTTFVTGGQLTAAITAADIAAAGSASVTAVNPDTTTSNALTFTIDPAGTPPPTPTLTSLAPSSATAGGAAFTLTVNGTNFVSGATVQWNGAARTTTFVSPTQLTAAITAADIQFGGTAQVTAVNPGTTPSNALTFTITGPTVTLVITGNPATPPYAIEAQVTNISGTLRVEFTVDGTLFRTEKQPKYCIFGGDTTCTLGRIAAGAGTHTVIARVFTSTGTTVLAQAQTTVSEGP